MFRNASRHLRLCAVSEVITQQINLQHRHFCSQKLTSSLSASVLHNKIDVGLGGSPTFPPPNYRNWSPRACAARLAAAITH